MEDEYEIMPHHELEKLKDEIGALRKSPSYKSGVTLQDSIENLSKQLKHMQNILEYASADLNNSESSDPLIHKLSSMEKKMDTIMGQNEKVARSVLILVDLIRQRELEELESNDKNDDESTNQEIRLQNGAVRNETARNETVQNRTVQSRTVQDNSLKFDQNNQRVQQNVPREYASYQMPDAQFPDLNDRANAQSTAQNQIIPQIRIPQSRELFNMQNSRQDLRQETLPAQQYQIPGPNSNFDSQSFNPQVQSLMQNSKVNFGSQPMQPINQQSSQQSNQQSQNWNNMNKDMNDMDLPPIPPGQLSRQQFGQQGSQGSQGQQFNTQNRGAQPIIQSNAPNVPEKKGLFGFLTIK